jgi:hypothetical protein
MGDILTFLVEIWVPARRQVPEITVLLVEALLAGYI